MTDDVVARLRSWVTDWNGAAMVRGEPPRDGLHCDDVYDAIDEIVALRAFQVAVLPENVAAHIRDEALEEAALECEARFCDGCAAGIRGLKEKH